TASPCLASAWLSRFMKSLSMGAPAPWASISCGSGAPGGRGSSSLSPSAVIASSLINRLAPVARKWISTSVAPPGSRATATSCHSHLGNLPFTALPRRLILACTGNPACGGHTEPSRGAVVASAYKPAQPFPSACPSGRLRLSPQPAITLTCVIAISGGFSHTAAALTPFNLCYP